MKNAELAIQDLETAIKLDSHNYAAQLTMRTPLIFLISTIPRLFNSQSIEIEPPRRAQLSESRMGPL
jgi:hypothetical protein